MHFMLDLTHVRGTSRSMDHCLLAHKIMQGHFAGKTALLSLSENNIKHSTTFLSSTRRAEYLLPVQVLDRLRTRSRCSAAPDSGRA